MMNHYWDLTRLYIYVLRAKLDIVGQVKANNVVFVQLYDGRNNVESCIPLYAKKDFKADMVKVSSKLRNMMFRYKNGLRYKRWIEI